jgi:hypothetical protein
MSQEIANVLDELAARFGATGAHLWEELVRYELAVAATSAGATLVLTIVFFALLRWAWPRLDDENVVFVVASVGIVLTISFIATLCYIPTMIAPEAAVLRGLLP